jgi:hypothetical protein
MEKQVSEGSLHKWFKGSKSKDGKGGWVNVVTGGTCASDEPGEGTPKCVSSAKRASMSKKERLSAARRKKKADPNQQQKSGAAKPTYVSTDKPKKKKMKESYTRSLTPLTEKAKKCWPGYEKKGTKKMFGKTYNNCVKKEEVEIVDEAMSSYDRNRKAAAKRAAQRNAERRAGTRGGRMERETYRSEGGVEMHHKGYRAEEVILERQKTNQGERQSEEQHQSTYGKATVRNKRKFGFSGGNAINAPKETSRGTLIDKRREEHKAKRGVKTKGVKEAYSTNPAQQAAIAIAKKKKKEDDMVAKKKKQKMYAGYEPEGELVDENILKDAGKKVLKFLNKPIITPTVTQDEFKKRVDDKTTNQLVEPGTQKNSYDPEGETIEEADKKGKGSGKKDACYHKVKSRYSVWPSAYASGALVKCRKVGAANWGNSSKKEDFSDWKSEFIWEDGDSSKKLTEEDELTKLRNAIKTGKMNGEVLTDKQLEGIKAAITQGGNKLEEDWQKTNRQDKTDGMSKAAVKAYRRENPGSKLKTAVTKKPSSLKRGSKDAKRRKSFCSRMKGMKKRLTSAKTARDPDSRINKALRRWNC